VIRTITDLEDVRVFARVVEAGSFTKAAAALGLPKSTVSRRVSKLERELGARLLQRTTRKLALTALGEQYFAHAERALAELAQAERAVSNTSGTPRGRLRVTMPSDFAPHVASALFAELTATYPELELVADLTNRRVDLVAEGIDVALRAGPLDDSSLTARRIAHIRFGLFASRAYLDRAGRPTVPTDLAAHACLSFGNATSRKSYRLQNAAEQIEQPVDGPLLCNDFGFLFHATRAGMGIASLPIYGCSELSQSSQLERILPDYQSGQGSLHAVYPSPRHLSTNVRTFIDFMTEGLTRLDLAGERCDPSASTPAP
jgi:DNA-binding transcriptional LysR family regulator